MPTNLWTEFRPFVADSPRILATVTAHNADGTSSLTTADGNSMRAWGQLDGLTLPYNAFVRDGKLEAPAPNLPLLQLTV
mgnify:CR=1 FL=1